MASGAIPSPWRTPPTSGRRSNSRPLCFPRPSPGGGRWKGEALLGPGSHGCRGLRFGPPKAGRNRRPPRLAGETRRPGRPPPGAEGPGARAGGAYPRPGPAGPSQGVAAHPSPTGGAAGARSAHKGGSQRLPPLVWPAAGRPYAAPPYAPSLTIRGMRQAPIQNATAGKRQMLARLTIRTSQCAGIPVLFFVWLSFYV